MKKIPKEKLLKTLRKLPDEELYKVMDEESDKSVDEIDPDFIMMCCDVLEERREVGEVDDEVFKQLLHMSDDTLNKIIDNEFWRPADQINYDVIDFCTEVLLKRHGHWEAKAPAPKKRITKKTVIKMIAVAAVVSILIATLTFVFADPKGGGFNFNNVKVVSYEDKTMALDFSNVDAIPDGYFLPESEKLAEMKAGGIEPLTLPEVLFNGEYDLQDIKTVVQKNNLNPEITSLTTVSARFSKGDIVGDVHVVKHHEHYFLDYIDNDYSMGGGLSDPRSGEEIKVNGLDVILIGYKGGNYMIQYFDRTQKVTYKLGMSGGTYEQVKELVASIK